MALTDHGSMYGVIPFYAAAKSAGINPIIGIEALRGPSVMADKEGKQDADHHHMSLTDSPRHPLAFDGSDFHPLDHWVATVGCRASHGGAWRHVELWWERRPMF